MSAEDFRPQEWDDYVGQCGIKDRLDVIVEAAKVRDMPLDHVLLLGPPGSGKTTLAKLIANRLSENYLEIPLPVKSVDTFCEQIEDACGGVVLLDELHNAPPRFQEMLQHILYEGVLVSPDGYKEDVSHFTFIGATTVENQAKLLPPLVQRFALQYTWQAYSDEEMAQIVRGMAHRTGVELADSVAEGLARAAGGTPRHVESLVKRARDLHATGREVTVESILDLAGLDADGLTVEHLQYLDVLRNLDSVSGLKNITNIMQATPATIESLERLLALRGFIRYTKGGRRLTATGRAKVAGRKM